MNKLLSLYQQLNNKVEFISPLFGLGIRLYLFNIFFNSGWTKIQSWETTKMLFAYEYNVPLLNPELAAWIGTGAELTLPVLLLIGIFSRPSALALFVFNAIAAFSYPDISPAGTVDHIMWGVMSAAIFFHGAGKLSLDHLLLEKKIDKKIARFLPDKQIEKEEQQDTMLLDTMIQDKKVTNEDTIKPLDETESGFFRFSRFIGRRPTRIYHEHH